VTIWTIGHSTRSIEELLAVLNVHGIETIVDVRRFPGSRRLPQFGSAALESALAEHGVDYRWIGALGGRRRRDPASPNDGWRNDAFRGYADHTASEEFAGGLFELEIIAWGSRSESTPRQIVRAWMASPGHRHNILQSRFREIGIAIVGGAPVRGVRRAATYATEFGAIRRH